MLKKISKFIMPLLFFAGISCAETSTNETTVLRYSASAKKSESGLELSISESKTNRALVIETELKYDSFLANINESYQSKVDRDSGSTLSYSVRRDNSFLIGSNKVKRDASFFPDRLEIVSIDSGSTNVYSFDAEGCLRDRADKPIVLDPMSVYYFIMNSKPEQLDGKKVLCSDGEEPWKYSFDSKKFKTGYKIKAETKKKNASFTCYVESNRVTEIDYLAGGVINIEFKLSR